MRQHAADAAAAGAPCGGMRPMRRRRAVHAVLPTVLGERRRIEPGPARQHLQVRGLGGHCHLAPIRAGAIVRPPAARVPGPDRETVVRRLASLLITLCLPLSAPANNHVSDGPGLPGEGPSTSIAAAPSC